MQDLHFATNDICIAACLANLALKSTDGLIKRKHTLKKGGTVGAMPPTHYLSKPGGEGGRIQGPGPAAPPPPGVKTYARAHNDAPSISKYGFLVQPNAQIAALR